MAGPAPPSPSPPEPAGQGLALASALRGPRRRGRERPILAATLVCAAGVPLAAAGWLSARTAELADRLGAAGGGEARIGGVDADLTGTVRLTDVGFGALISAEAVEASVGLDSLLAGALRADEIRVAGPRVALHVDDSGDSDLARLARRLVGTRSRSTGTAGPGAPGRLRRIVVSSGTLTAQVAGLGELSAERVELVPDAGGVRVLTGPVRLDGRAGPLRAELGFTRASAELALPHVRFGRVLAVGGAGTVWLGPAAAPPVALRDVAVGRLAASGALELHASVDDGGIPRPLTIDLQLPGPAGDVVAVSTPLRSTSSIVVRGHRIPLGSLAELAPPGIRLDGARATGSITVRRDRQDSRLEIDAAFDGLALDHRVIAPAPVVLAATVRAQIAVTPEAVAVPQAAVELGAARWTASGWWRRGAPASGQIDLALATAGCRELLAALPGELRGPLDGMVLAGQFGGRLRLTVDLAAPPGDGVELSAAIADGCRTEVEPPGADVTRLTGPSDQSFPDGSRARVGMGEPGWAQLRQLPPHVVAAFVSAEDARFYHHGGFDLGQIAKSLEIDLREHRLVRGGSTISQQLVKNAFLTQRRSFDRKLQEAILTWRLEARLDKRQILERYLNIIELGPRIYGVTAAARYWFDARPRDLTVRQAAFLAALTSEPTSMSRRVRRAGGLDADSATRVEVVLLAMRRDGMLDAEQLDAARRAPLRFTSAASRPER